MDTRNAERTGPAAGISVQARAVRQLMNARHLTLDELTAGIPHIERSPKDCGVLRMIVRRPRPGVRELLDEAALDEAVGLVGDTWNGRVSSRTADGSPHLEMQLTINAKVVQSGKIRVGDVATKR